MSDSKELIIKNAFHENIKKWTLLDSRIKVINEKTKEMREMRNRIESDIVRHLEENNMTHRKISVNDSELKIVEKKNMEHSRILILKNV